PSSVALSLPCPSFECPPWKAEHGCWGLTQTGIARRLCRRWHLPRWLAVSVGHLGLPAETAKSLGADLELFRVVQLAVLVTQELAGTSVGPDRRVGPVPDGDRLGKPDLPAPAEQKTREETAERPSSFSLSPSLSLEVCVSEAEAVSALGLSEEDTTQIRRLVPLWAAEFRKAAFKNENPVHVPLLRDLLRLAAENRRPAGTRAAE